ncbi:pyrroline-5-carboxylate reductase [Spirochaetia bacterium 38H-sp]|uniref:Pyrroline-5-carboxylate reductase n=1 Tax=Rarispira pelagica TaxID=3141764 RepID=A0ABU9UDR6_9SPIR
MRAIGCVGFGVMGEALIKGLRKEYPDSRLLVVEKSQKRMELAISEYRAENYNAKSSELFTLCDAVILAIKPQDIDVLRTMAPSSCSAVIFSIIAGKPISWFSEVFSTCEIVRAMPNISAMVGKAPVAISLHPDASERALTVGRAVASAVGTCFEIPERLMPAFTGLSGSGIAYVLSFMQGMALGGTKAGISYSQSLEIVSQLIEGTIALQKELGNHPEELVSRVTSPAGTTIEGIHALESGGFKGLVINAVVSAAERAKDFEK